MRKKPPSVTDHLSEKEKRGAVESALAGGMEPVEVFKAVLAGIWGVNERKKLIIEWGRKMNLEPNEALRVAHRAHLIASVRNPFAQARGKPQRSILGETSE